MDAGLVAIFLTFFGPVAIVLWNKIRCKGKLLCFIARKDKSLKPALCELRDAFVIWGNRAYDVYPDFIRICGYPVGWPSILQELVPSSLYDEDDALPKDWVTLKTPEEGSLRLRSALDENWIRKLVQESSSEGRSKINWRKIIPIVLMALGALGLVGILFFRNYFTGPTK